MVAGITLQVVTYRAGETFISNIASIMGSVVKVSSMIGITVIGALAFNYTAISTTLATNTTIVSADGISTKVTSVQADIFDKIAPFFLQMVLVGTIYICMSKYN